MQAWCEALATTTFRIYLVHLTPSPSGIQRMHSVLQYGLRLFVQSTPVHASCFPHVVDMHRSHAAHQSVLVLQDLGQIASVG